MTSQHESGPWRVKRTGNRWSVYAHRCDCQDCQGRKLAWPLAVYQAGRVFTPPAGVPLGALEHLLTVAQAPLTKLRSFRTVEKP